MVAPVPTAQQIAQSPLYFEETGAGDPLVCLHGFGASTYTWRDVMPSLAAAHKVYALDLKGHGRSPKPEDGRYAVADHAALVLQFIADHNLPSVTLVGHSFGGGVALSVAVELEKSRPGVLKSLILIDAAAYRQRLPAFIRVLRTPVFGPIIQRVVPVRAQVKNVLKLAYYNDDRVPQASIDAYAAALRLPGGRYALRETAKEIVPGDIDDVSAGYATIRAPTLLVWARHDAIIPLSIGERLRQAIPNSRLVIVENAGHQVHEESPAEVRKAIDAFLIAEGLVTSSAVPASPSRTYPLR